MVRPRRHDAVEIVVLDLPEGNVIARGSKYGGPDYQVFVAADGRGVFPVGGDADMVWAGPNAESFRRIAAAWNRYRLDVVGLPTEEAQLERVAQVRRELTELGALPTDVPLDPEPLWSLLVSEAEFGMA